MVNRYYDPGEHRAAKVSDLFATIARRYDLINDLQSFGLHRHWKRRLIRLADIQSGERALDLCCGTGDIAFAIARKGGEVTGLDFSEPMLAVARQRLDVERIKFEVGGKVKFLRGDAQHIPFQDNSFNVVTISYGLRNLADWECGLREMLRVAKPGGRLLVLDFGKPANAFWRKSYFAYLGCFVPVFGKLFCGDAATYAYILDSLKHFPAQEGIAAKLRELNCAEVRVVNLLGGVMGINYGRKMSSNL
jgi:demethylmenaquinone methyltransferase/2-methoxy-6-polyprenyl-1,4-benzoquinol methylase